MSISRRSLLKSSIALPSAALGLAVSSPARADDDDDNSVGKSFYTMTTAAAAMKSSHIASSGAARKRDCPNHSADRPAARAPVTARVAGCALTLNTDRNALFAVNAGSNTVAMLRIGRNGLLPAVTAPSGGQRPIAGRNSTTLFSCSTKRHAEHLRLVVSGSTLQPWRGRRACCPQAACRRR